ncbi:hypothetical protein, partial [Blautia obeum]|uniref:hypothetical protein n=2 Tax=Blautia TaxID=572511 RepID=UPI001A9BE166
ITVTGLTPASVVQLRWTHYNKKDMANFTMSSFESSGYSHSALLLAYNQIAVDLVRLQEDS